MSQGKVKGQALKAEGTASAEAPRCEKSLVCLVDKGRTWWLGGNEPGRGDLGEAKRDAQPTHGPSRPGFLPQTVESI